MERSIVFHHPLPLVAEGASGSQVRPYKMLEAFRQLGYSVEVVAGYARDRKRAVERVQHEAARGRAFAFAYAEATTGPTLLTETHHLPLWPFLDFGLFRWLKQRGVPIGLFYRDVHWRFGHYRRQLSWPKVMVSLPFFYYDWWQYLRLVDHLFLPSRRMKCALPSPWPPDHLTALPPGCPLPAVPPKADRWATPSAAALRLFYVGGVTPSLYNLKPMVDLVQAVEGVTLTLCCHQLEWQRALHYYEPLDKRLVRIVHAQGQALAECYQQADAFLLAWARTPYLDFAMPVKLFEALGYALPVITTGNTEAARFVAEEDIGWVVAGPEELRRLLSYLRDNPGLVAQKRERVLAARERHTWRARAQLVADVLGPARAKEASSAHSAR